MLLNIKVEKVGAGRQRGSLECPLRTVITIPCVAARIENGVEATVPYCQHVMSDESCLGGRQSRQNT